MISQDIVVALKLLEYGQWPGFAELSTGLRMSLSQVSRSIVRLAEARILSPEKSVHRWHLSRFIINGVPYAFPVRLGEVTRGIPTAWACPGLKETKLASLLADDLVPVWPDIHGRISGRAIQPLHRGVAHAVENDPQLYAMLALIDVLRVGRVRERQMAEEEIETRLGHAH